MFSKRPLRIVSARLHNDLRDMLTCVLPAILGKIIQTIWVLGAIFFAAFWSFIVWDNNNILCWIFPYDNRLQRGSSLRWVISIFVGTEYVTRLAG
jgi:hypothetical protein